MTNIPQRAGNTPAIVALVAAIVAIPTFVFDLGFIAWAAAIIGLIAGIIGVKRAFKGASGMVMSWIAIALSSIALLTLIGTTVVSLVRLFR